MAARMVVLWAKRRILLKGRIPVSVVEGRTKRLFSCKHLFPIQIPILLTNRDLIEARVVLERRPFAHTFSHRSSRTHQLRCRQGCHMPPLYSIPLPPPNR